MIAEFYTCPMALRIRELRKAKGFSQQILAEKAGISRSQLSEIESETKPANTLRLNAIAAALSVSVDQLFEEGAQDVYLTEIAALMETMTPEDRATIIRMAQALARPA
jgi:transcriptional regulator with XRE-family HTH domain